MAMFGFNFCFLRKLIIPSKHVSFCADGVWNSSLFFQHHHPEFTKCYQYTLLCCPPMLLLMMPLFFNSSLKQPQKIMKMGFNFKYMLRLFIQFVIAALFIVELRLNFFIIEDQPDLLEIISYVLNVIAIVCVIVLTEYRRRTFNMICPIIFLYWLTMFLCYSVRFYSNIFRLDQSSCLSERMHTLYLTVSGMQFFLLLISFVRECITDYSEKDSLLEETDPCPQIYASILSKLLYSWLDPLIIRWYRVKMDETNVFDLRIQESCSKNTKEVEEILSHQIEKQKSRTMQITNGLRPVLFSTSSTSNETSSQLLQYHDAYSNNVHHNISDTVLCSSLMRIFIKDVLMSWASKFIHDILIFTSPVILKIIIQYASDPSRPDWQGYALAVLLLLSAVFSAISENFCFFTTNCLGIKLRAALIGLVYRKALKVSNEIRNKYTTGEIVNYMSVDAERIMAWATNSWFIFSAPLQIFICLFFLYNLLGYSMIAGIVVIIIFLPINGLAMKLEQKYSELELISKDRRIKTISEMLKGIKVLKMYGWEPSFINKISTIRNEEVGHIRNKSLTWSLIAIVWDFQPFMVMLATFFVHVYTRNNSYITAEVAFVSLSLFGILKMPMSMLPFGIVDSLNAYISVKRITKFLVSEEINKDFIHHVEDPVDERSPNDVVIDIQSGCFTWQSQDMPLLQDINIKIQRGKLIAIVGKIGSGKTSLLSAILGEMTRLRGELHLRGSLAYVPQEAWIQNQTVQQNILFYKPFVPEIYNKVLDACALLPDLTLLLGGDQTEIGERGINLSGGQKQRISLARSVYQDKDIYLLDDPLSAVDNQVGQHLFKRVISNHPGSLLANKTRILVTHGIQWLPKVDEIIIMENGKVAQRGSFKELMTKGSDLKNIIEDNLNKQFNGAPHGNIDEQYIPGLNDNESSVDLEVSGLPTSRNTHNSTRQDYFSKRFGEKNIHLDFEHDRLTAAKPYQLLKNIHMNFNGPSLEEKTNKDIPSILKSVIQDNNQISSLKRFYENIVDTLNQLRTRNDSYETLKDDSVGQINTSHTMQNLSQEEQNIKTKFKELGQLTTEEEAICGNVKWSTYFTYLRTWSFICVFGSFSCFGVFAISQLYGNMWLVKFTSDPNILNASKDIFLYPDNFQNYSAIIQSRVDYYMNNYAFVGTVQLISVSVFWTLLFLGCVRSSRVLHSMLLHGIIHSPLSFFDTTPSGRVLNRFSRDMDTVDHTIPFNISNSISGACSVAMCLLIIAFVTPRFISIMVPIFLVYFLAQRIYLPSVRQSRRYSSIATSPIFNQFTETLLGASTIRAFQQQKAFEHTNQGLVDRSSTFLFILFAATRWMGLRLDLLGALLVLFATIFAVSDRETLTGSLIGLSIAYSLQITDHLNWFVRQANELETNSVSIERIREYNGIPAEAEWENEDGGVYRADGRKWPTSGRIQFINYGLKYRNGLPLVLNNINLEIKSAEKIGIVGRTGAGKSSIIQAILRLVDPAAAGSIFIDGRNIAHLPLHVLRRAITVLPQDPLIFSGTVRENMDPVGYYVRDPGKIEKALEQAHLLKWLEDRQNEKLKEKGHNGQLTIHNRTKPSCGLNYECGEGGVNLSSGQRQLMCLARALLRESHILILDEATASVDVETDELVMETIRTCFDQCTVIIIAHRINTIMDCDRVIVLEKGEVIEQGNPRQLVAQEFSLFKRMTQSVDE